MQTLDRDEVSAVLAARPEDVYALVADVTRTPQFSPEVTSVRWLDGATGPAVGARFESVNTAVNGRTWKNRPVITVVEPGREFAFTRTEPFAGTITWRYRLEPVQGGTRVTESYTVERPVSRLGWLVIEKKFAGTDRRTALRQGMRTTLERLRRALEPDPAGRP
ncbi:MAG TPA: SRPBCC family protein [Blastococcus sp.]|nr:SRPBCC family protein [Blastococcus sp.]